MDLLTRDDLRTLLQHREGPCVSCFLRTTRGVANADKLRLKNQVREAEERLKELGARGPESKDRMAPARALLDDLPFWQNMIQGGLAAFAAPGLFRTFRLPLELDDRVYVGRHFQVLPLLPLFAGDGRFFVLSLSQKKLRFFRGTRHTVEEVQLVDVPESMDEALFNTDAGETRSNVMHPPTDPSSEKRQEILRGPGHKTESRKDGILEYFKRVDRGLQRYLHDQTAPLVLAGVEYEVARYREANGYRYLLDEALTGSFDRIGAQDLHGRAWPLVEPHFRREEERLGALYQQMASTAGQGRTSKDIADIVKAAYQGHVQYLFLARGEERRGTFNPDDLTVTVHDGNQQGGEDLMNLAASFALAHKGTVYAVEPERMPDVSPHAAIFWLPLGERSSKTTYGEAMTGAKAP